ncbi:MAG: formimidoylglutamase [Chitinophagaceae bacterium]
MNIIYTPGQIKNWAGRKTDPGLGIQYWYQAIELVDIVNFLNEEKITKKNPIEKKPTIALIGYQCDEGIRRNLGRVGAVNGPRLVREKLAKVPLHFDNKRLVDLGDIACVNEDMETCQQAFSEIISQLITQNIFPIGIGGGHDIAYAHFMGIREATKHSSHRKIGIINFDAHFDLRPIEDKPNSGTPFNQIIETLREQNESVDYFVIGIQRQSNTPALFETAKNEKVEFVYSIDCEPSENDIKNIQVKLVPLINNNDHLYISIDLDGFSSAYAPGVSAPSSLGFSPTFVYKMLDFLFKTKKVVSFDIAELNPVVDQDDITANLAAKLVDYIASFK